MLNIRSIIKSLTAKNIYGRIKSGRVTRQRLFKVLSKQKRPISFSFLKKFVKKLVTENKGGPD